MRVVQGLHATDIRSAKQRRVLADALPSPPVLWRRHPCGAWAADGSNWASATLPANPSAGELQRVQLASVVRYRLPCLRPRRALQRPPPCNVEGLLGVNRDVAAADRLILVDQASQYTTRPTATDGLKPPDNGNVGGMLDTDRSQQSYRAEEGITWQQSLNFSPARTPIGTSSCARQR